MEVFALKLPLGAMERLSGQHHSGSFLCLILPPFISPQVLLSNTHFAS